MTSILLLSICLLYEVYGRSHDTISASDYPSSTDTLWTACNHLEDGYHWIKPLKEDKYPAIYVQCSGGYTMLNPSLLNHLNHHHIKSIFTSYVDVTDFAASSALNDHVAWKEWFIPADEYTKWAISEKCDICSETEDYGTDSVYYMTGNYIGCEWATKGFCDMDPHTLECYICTGTAKYLNTPLSGLCSHMIASANRPVNSEHDQCVNTGINAEPSIGTNGQYCVCYKPQTAGKLPAGTIVLSDPPVTETQDKNTVIEIYNDAFVHGTYRITQPGIYVVMEDIEFNMNRGDYNDPNAEGMWYPKHQQESHYMGAGGSFIGPYSMGFFAGFAIESDDVTIDLNGHELAMSRAFHLQQRWFSAIEVGSKPFISGQGPGNFGPYMIYANNVVIKNGIIGRSSHHGIHANGFENLVIKDIHIKHFEVAGMQMNGFIGLTLENVEIGPVYQQVPVMEVYTQARIMLPRLRKAAVDNPEGTVAFHNRGSFTADEVLNELQSQMDIMFDNIINDIAYEDMDEDAERIAAARSTFENVRGLPSSATAYGIFLNSYGASVFAISGAPGESSTVKANNVKIHGIYKDPWEVPRLGSTKGPFNDIMDFTRVTNDGLETTESEYIGSAYSDAQYAIHKLSEDWAVLSHSVIDPNVDSWISSGESLPDEMSVICNGDIMLHVTKGVFGFRVDNVDNIYFNNIQISDLQNIGALGSNVCGNYDSSENGGHRNQIYPLQRGFTGTEVHALSFVKSSGFIDNININNIISARGDALAIQFYPSNDIEIGANIHISDIHAGAHLPKDLLLSLDDSMPNKIPRACAIAQWTWTDVDDGYIENVITFVDKSAINAQCLTMHMSCSDSDYEHETVGEQIKACDDTNIVKNPKTPNHLIYTNYVRYISDNHNKLYNIMENDHKLPDFYSPQAFVDHPQYGNTQKKVSQWPVLFFVWIAIIVFAAVYVVTFASVCKFNIYSKKRKQTELSLDNEYKPLLDRGTNY